MRGRRGVGGGGWGGWGGGGAARRHHFAAPMAPRHRRTRKALAAQAAPLIGGTAGRALAPPWGAGSADHHADQRVPLRALPGRDGYWAQALPGHTLADWWRRRSLPALRRSGG